MNTVFRKSFERDLKRIKDGSVLRQIKEVVEEIESAAGLHELGRIRKLTGAGSF